MLFQKSIGQNPALEYLLGALPELDQTQTHTVPPEILYQ